MTGNLARASMCSSTFGIRRGRKFSKSRLRPSRPSSGVWASAGKARKAKHEIRNTKFETNSKHERGNDQNGTDPSFRSFRIWDFVLVSDFVLRASDLSPQPR